MTIENKVIYTHPSNLGALGTIQIPFDTIPGGLPVYIDKNIPATQPTGKVKFPTDGNWKFCEFEEKDEGWTLALGIATREEEPVYYTIDQSKLKISLGMPIRLDWSIEDKTTEIYKAYTQEIQERVLQSITERLKKEIEDNFTKDMMRTCTQQVIYGAL